jgi:hypothetical protein
MQAFALPATQACACNQPSAHSLGQAYNAKSVPFAFAVAACWGLSPTHSQGRQPAHAHTPAPTICRYTHTS